MNGDRPPCADDPEAWFPEDEEGEAGDQACLACFTGCGEERRVKCLERAIADDERFGIWGGWTTRERDRLQRNRMTA